MTVVHQLMSMPLVPSGFVRKAFDNARSWILESYLSDDFCNLDGNEKIKDLKHTFAKVFEYFEDEWLKRWKPIDYCVVNSKVRTNNVVEAYHRTLNAVLVKNPAPVTFVRECIRLYKSIKNLQ